MGDSNPHPKVPPAGAAPRKAPPAADAVRRKETSPTAAREDALATGAPQGHPPKDAPLATSSSDKADAPATAPRKAPSAAAREGISETPSTQWAPPGTAPRKDGPATLYLIPCWLEEQVTAPLAAPYLLDAVRQCTVFFVENERSARRYLKTLWKEMVIDDYEWHTIHKAEEEVKAIFRQKLKEGRTIGLISEAGCPGIADPGQILTEAAHQAGAIVRPLVGPSSILLALMASGLNGQQFRFTGYLPVDNAARAKALKDLEAESQRLRCTMLFIETPYRNNQLLDAILANCRPATRLCVAANLTGPAEYIRTLTIADWRKLTPPDSSTGPAAKSNSSAASAPDSPAASSPAAKSASPAAASPASPAASAANSPAAPDSDASSEASAAANPSAADSSASVRSAATPSAAVPATARPDLHKQPTIFALLA